jgi:hypothetical protein
MLFLLWVETFVRIPHRNFNRPFNRSFKTCQKYRWVWDGQGSVSWGATADLGIGTVRNEEEVRPAIGHPSIVTLHVTTPTDADGRSRAQFVENLTPTRAYACKPPSDNPSVEGGRPHLTHPHSRPLRDESFRVH